MTQEPVTDNNKRRSQFYFVRTRFMRNKLAVIGLVFFILVVIITVSADLFMDYQDVLRQNISVRLQKPSTRHIFGTDIYGRDLFGRMVFGARYSLGIGLAVTVISLIAGVILGAISGYFGGIIGEVIMRIMDIFYSMPSALLAIAIVAALGQTIPNLLLAMSVSRIAQFSRVVRSVVLPIRSQEFIEAAKAAGAGNAYIIRTQILPNAIGPIIVQATLGISVVILGIAGLGFLGLGVAPPTPEWGSILSDVRVQVRNHPYLAIIPGITICMCAMALNLIGDGLRDALDPKLKN